jgi:two-component system OmpR family sensor kinase
MSDMPSRRPDGSADIAPPSHEAFLEVERLPDEVQAVIRSLCHEMRTPITIARGHADLLWDASKGRRALGDVEVVLEELDRLARLADRIMLLAAAGDPRFLAPAVLDLESLLVARASCWSVVAKRDWRVEVPHPESVVADAARLVSALDALVENAVEHTGEGDEIVISARREQDFVTVDVQDRGTGIASRDLAGLFGGVPQDGRALRGRPGATGLGLRIVKAIAVAHGGSVAVSSVVNQGSTFSIRLPRVASPMERGPTSG